MAAQLLGGSPRDAVCAERRGRLQRAAVGQMPMHAVAAAGLILAIATA